jgi:hypothetical protein
MAPSKATSSAALRERSDGRRQLLIYLDAELIKELKKTALDEERAAYELAEEAIRAWLKKRRARADKATKG